MATSEDFYAWSKSEDFNRYLEYTPHKSINESDQYLNILKKRSNSINCHFWTICDKKGQVIGSFSVHNINLTRGSCEIGYGLHPKVWGKKYFKEALSLVTNYLFNEFNFHRIVAITNSNNMPSVNGLISFGFVKEGILREYYLDQKDGIFYDALILSFLKSDYKSRSINK